MDQLATDTDVIKASRGAIFKPDREFIEFVDALPADIPAIALRTLLKSATDRLRRSSSEPSFEIDTITHVKLSYPCQWEGKLTDGEEFFIRYKDRTLKAFIDDSLVECIDLEEVEDLKPHAIQYNRVRTLLSGTFVFPDECKVIPAKV